MALEFVTHNEMWRAQRAKGKHGTWRIFRQEDDTWPLDLETPDNPPRSFGAFDSEQEARDKALELDALTAEDLASHAVGEDEIEGADEGEEAHLVETTHQGGSGSSSVDPETTEGGESVSDAGDGTKTEEQTSEAFRPGEVGGDQVTAEGEPRSPATGESKDEGKPRRGR